MKRTSNLIPVLNALMAPSLRSRNNPDRVFWKLLERAGDQAGDHPPMHEADIDGYRRLLAGFATAPGLSGLGWAMARGDVQARIANQMRIEALHAAHPEIGREVIERPIVIVGLPRTGTTVTHKVIAQSAGHRAPALWELMHTSLALPPREEARLVRQIDQVMRLVLRLAPSMRAIHPQAAAGADEDPFLLPHGAQHLARAPMRGYETWCYQRDYTRDYDLLKKAYQVLQHGREPQRWVIKSPTHLANLDQIIRVFPDAQIVWMHRAPVTVMGSICSLVETSWQMHVHRPDPAEVGQMCLRMLPWMVERARAARTVAPGQGRAAVPREQIIDVPYHDVVVDKPHEKMPVLYDRLGAKWTADDAARLGATMARPTKRTHEYAIKWFGLNEDEVEQAFGDYSRVEAAMSFT
ncbi:sulfotransferase family protein [Glycomyces sp. MUSA5-2]|uniref:sulfotransferase family protein n=1 Tax=Glycomyces sp. MUSA5-2 TaxID=2053002 RepID=UPI00300A9EE3